MSYIQQNKFKELKTSSTIDVKLSTRKCHLPDTTGHETQDTYELKETVTPHRTPHVQNGNNPASGSGSRHNVLHTVKKLCVVDICWQ